MSTRWDVLGLGAVAVDDLVFVDRFPLPGTKVAVESIERHGGGLTGTALVTAARLGARTAYCGVLGYDGLSQSALRELVSEGVDCAPCIRRPQARPVHSVVIVVRQTGQRTVLFSHAGVVGPPPDQLTPELVGGCRLLLVDNTQAQSGWLAARLARERRIPVVADFEPGAGRHAPDLLRLVDHLIVGVDFARGVTGETEPARMVHALSGPERACCAVTAAGDRCWYRQRGGEVRHHPAFAVEVVDTTGCGDVFHGAYAASIARGESIDDAITFASAAAALKATVPGGRAGIPDRAAVLTFLARRT